MSHAWNENRILTHLPAARQLYSAYTDDSKPFPPPRFISCWVSEKCNLDCTYCFFSDTNHDKSHLYIDTHKFLSWLSAMREFGAEALEFSGGGEPTLHPDFRMIYEHAKNMMGYQLGIITHGCNDMPLLSMADNFNYIRIGLDAATAGTHDAIKRNKRKNYWFDKAIENIQELVEIRESAGQRKFTVGIKIILNQINFHELDKMIDLARTLRVNYIQIKREHSSDNDLSQDQIFQAEDVIKRASRLIHQTQVKGTMFHARATTGCFMSPIHTVVTATGKILQCCFFEDRPIGTIFQPIAEVWGGAEHRRVMRRTTIQECDKIDCRWNGYNSRMKEMIEDPLAQASFI